MYKTLKQINVVRKQYNSVMGYEIEEGTVRVGKKGKSG